MPARNGRRAGVLKRGHERNDSAPRPDQRYHCPVQFLEFGKGEAVIDARDETPCDQPDNADIVQHIPDASYCVRMVGYCVEDRAQSKIEGSTGQETAECEDIAVRGALISDCNGSADGTADMAGEEVIYGFVMHIAQRLKRHGEGARC
ncbi:hypothetical protein PAAG_11381 [Paracoccidioides lutzii Pb01]|uniref:Uncharacterized protein n=1 Tax=Paracoccidioides lutzii (strain ATCC MYA-826 / Pb01) TaxID=502779 RepID=A0A0A2VLS6_PARBA|nr:hypothetical protein PAAG_11381 [Paracoccidioides lutzii Pb01]KGQ01809.1 hypothetical protein PAAG_11381 [Paracoccidioides lutzii Pb01]